MHKNICNRPANCHRGCKFAQVRSVLVLVNGAILATEDLQPQVDRRNSKNAICEYV